MNIYILLLTTLALAAPAADISAPPKSQNQMGVYDIRAFGAVGDGETVNTVAIQKAIDACAENGGGRVLIPPGRFVTGTIILKSHVDLHVAAGAFLLGSTNVADYPNIRTKHQSLYTNHDIQQLIYAENATNISITGLGTINGRGGAFIKRAPDPISKRMQPFMYNIRFIQCEHVHVADVTLRDSSAWMQQYLACNYVQVRGIKIFNHCNKNNDLIDIDGCSNVTISDLIGSSEDDGITLKSTGPDTCENIAIANCVIHSNVNALKFGTESTGGFRNVTVSNIIIHRKSIPSKHIHGLPGDNWSAIALMIADGGTLENVRISNIVADGAWVPLFIRLGNRARPHRPGAKVERVGVVRNIEIDGLVVNAHDFMSHITGIPGHPVRDITIRNVRIASQGGKPLAEFHKPVPEKEQAYPDSMMFGSGPAYGFFIRHAENIRLENIELTARTPDLRPGVIVDQARKVVLEDLDIQCFEGNETAIAVRDSQDVEIRDTRITGKTRAFLQVRGGNSKDIHLRGIRPRNIGELLECKDGADPNQVVIQP